MRGHWRWVLVLATAVSMLGLNPDRVGAVPPPYDADDNKLMDRKLGKINSGDPQWLVDGKFYDVGRNPAPLPGNPQTDWGDLRFRVTHITFDWSPDVGAGGKPKEALQIQYDRSKSLDHINDNRVKGEWVYKWADDPAKGRHEPALYACRNEVTVKVRIECANPIVRAEIGAKQVPQDQPPLTQWLDVRKTLVDFAEIPTGSGRYVSKGPLDPVTGSSEYVDMPLSGAIRDDINKSRCTWQWYVDGTDTGGGPRYASAICQNKLEGWEINRSEGYKIVQDADGNDVEVTVPHTFYTVLGKPTAPYYRAVQQGSSLTTAYPWVNALEFAIVTHVELAGIKIPKSTVNPDSGEAIEVGAADKIANFCYSRYHLEYLHRGGDAMWVDADSLGQREFYTFRFSQFLAGVGKKIVCFDQGCAVATLIDLTCGIDATVHWLPEFGYVNRTGFVGGQECNNPFWEMAGYVSDKVVPANDTMWRLDAGGLVKRSAFACHCWCEAAGGTVYDATVGTTGVNGAATIIAGRTAYRAQVCDVSQTNPPWQDDESLPLKRNGWNPTSPPEPWIEWDAQHTTYTIGVDDEGESVTHANFARVKTKDIELR